MKDMTKRNNQRKVQDKLYRNLIKAGYSDDDRVEYLRPDGYLYTVQDIRQYLIYGIENLEYQSYI
jgi:ribosomal protein L32E